MATDRALPPDRRQAGTLSLQGTSCKAISGRRFTRSQNDLHVLAEFRLPRARSWKGMQCERCMHAAARPTTTWRLATQAYWKTLNLLWQDMVEHEDVHHAEEWDRVRR